MTYGDNFRPCISSLFHEWSHLWLNGQLSPGYPGDDTPLRGPACSQLAPIQRASCLVHTLITLQLFTEWHSILGKNIRKFVFIKVGILLCVDSDFRTDFQVDSNKPNFLFETLSHCSTLSMKFCYQSANQSWQCTIWSGVANFTSTDIKYSYTSRQLITMSYE